MSNFVLRDRNAFMEYGRRIVCHLRSGFVRGSPLLPSRDCLKCLSQYFKWLEHGTDYSHFCSATIKIHGSCGFLRFFLRTLSGDKAKFVYICAFDNYTRQQDFGTWKLYCVCILTFHAEFKYAITIFPSPTVFVQWHILLSIFRNFRYFLQWFFYTWTNILNSFEQRVVTDNLPLSNH